MNLATVGTVVSLLTTLVFIAGSLITIRSRRLSTEAKELRELRDYNVAAMGYIYDLEMTLTEMSKKTNTSYRVDKPEILKTSYIEERAQTSGNPEIQQLAEMLRQIQSGGLPELGAGKSKGPE
jgi:hypothetical protein